MKKKFIIHDPFSFRKRVFKKQFLTLKLSFLLCLGCVMNVSAGMSSNVSGMEDTKVVTGTVTDVEGVLLPGVSVSVKGTTIGTTTGIEGDYSLEASPGEVLVFSFVGYVTQEEVVDDRDEINVTLREDIRELDQVVVIGYGVQRRSDQTGAISSVSSEEMTAMPVSRMEDALQGRASGMFVQSATGAPGSDVNIRIRGITSISDETNPLWIVDGVSADPSTVNPNDIESIEVLKDASAAAIYGSQAANGVILVTTKRGEAGRTKVSFDANYGWQSPAKLMDLADGGQYAKMYTFQQALKGGGPGDFYFGDYIDFSGDKAEFNFQDVPSYNYQEEVFRRAQPMQKYSLGISGGNENSTFYMGIGYTNEEGILDNSAYENYNARINSSHEVNDWLTVGQNFSLNHSVYTGWEEWQMFDTYHSSIINATWFQPFVPVTGGEDSDYVTQAKEDGSDNWTNSPMGNIENPVSMNELLNTENQYSSLKATAFAIIEPLEGLTYESRITGDLNHDKDFNYLPRYFITGQHRRQHDEIHRSAANYRGWEWQHFINYQESFLDDHNVGLMGGFEASSWKSEWMYAQRSRLINDEEEMWYFDASTHDNDPPAYGAAVEASGYSYFGRVNYDFRRTFLGQFNLRKDYSSKFGPENRSGVFPSFSTGIRFSEFDLVQTNFPWLSFGRVRYGWGKVGNDAIDDYAYYSSVALMNVYNYSFSNDPSDVTTGASIGALANTGIKWESVVTNNIGLDLGIMDNQLYLTFEYFDRYNEGMLLRTDVPGYAGFFIYEEDHEGGAPEPYANVGELSNKGFELSASWQENRGDFRYGIDFNFTYVTTETVELSRDTISRGSGYLRDIEQQITRTIQGGAIGEFHGLKTDGIFKDWDEIDNYTWTDPETGETQLVQPNARPGDLKFVDVNDDGRITFDDDMTAIGNPNAPYLFGLNFNIQYGIFDFSMFLQGVYGNELFNATRFYQYNQTGSYNWSADYVENQFIIEDIYATDGTLLFEANTNGKYPQINESDNSMNQNFEYISDFYVEDGSYLRLKNIQVGVTLPDEISNRMGIDRLRVYGSISNLFTITNYSGYDPDLGYQSDNILLQGIDMGAYPNARMYSLGMNLNF